MDERKVNEKQRALPGKIEQRLAELAQMEEFGRDDMAHCRRTYWTERDAWHQILIDCYERAIKRAAVNSMVS